MHCYDEELERLVFVYVRDEWPWCKKKKSLDPFLKLFMELKALYIDLLQIVRNGSVYFQFQA